jgi:hypothetical protein
MRPLKREMGEKVARDVRHDKTTNFFKNKMLWTSLLDFCLKLAGSWLALIKMVIYASGSVSS